MASKKCNCYNKYTTPPEYYLVARTTVDVERNTFEDPKRPHTMNCVKMALPCTPRRLKNCVLNSLWTMTSEWENCLVDGNVLLEPVRITGTTFTVNVYITKKRHMKDVAQILLGEDQVYGPRTLMKPYTAVSSEMEENRSKAGTLVTDYEPMYTMTKTLKPHQVKNVAWMRDCEGEPFGTIWTKYDNSDIEGASEWYYVNGVPSSAALERPTVPCKHGGFICDEMGMGKTISAAGMIAADPGGAHGNSDNYLRDVQLHDVATCIKGPVWTKLIRGMMTAEPDPDPDPSPLVEIDEPMEDSPVAPEPLSPPPPTPPGITCKNCTLVNPEGSTTCSTCSKELGDPTYNECGQCTFHNTLTAATCEICDFALEPIPVPSPVPEAPVDVIVDDELDEDPAAEPAGSQMDSIVKMPTGATLYVTKPVLVDQAVKEFQKTIPGINIVKYHGQKRTQKIEDLLEADLVVTAYNTIASDCEWMIRGACDMHETTCFAPLCTKNDDAEVTTLRDNVQKLVYLEDGRLVYVTSVQSGGALSLFQQVARVYHNGEYLQMKASIRCTRAKKKLRETCGGAIMSGLCRKCYTSAKKLPIPKVTPETLPRPIGLVYWDRVFLDESQSVKSKSAKATRTITRINRRSTWFLTGTPVEKNKLDLATQMTGAGLVPTNWSDASKVMHAFGACALRTERDSESLSATCVTHDIEVRMTARDMARYNLAIRAAQVEYANAQVTSGVSTLSATRRFSRVIAIAALGSMDRLLPADYDIAPVSTYSYMAAPRAPPSTDRTSVSEKPITWSSVMMDADDECSLCFDNFEDPVSTVCKHVFCKECVVGWFEARPSCPICRKAGRGLKPVAEDKEKKPAAAAAAPAPAPVTTAPAVSAATSPKIAAVMTKIQTLITEDSTNRIIVFSQHKTCINTIIRALADSGISAARLDGERTIKSRHKSLSLFSKNSAGSTKVLVANINSGSTGLDIFAANHVIFTDITFNRAKEKQAIGRAYRIGQQRDVNVWRYYVSGTAEGEALVSANDPVKTLRMQSRAVVNSYNWSSENTRLRTEAQLV